PRSRVLRLHPVARELREDRRQGHDARARDRQRTAAVLRTAEVDRNGKRQVTLAPRFPFPVSRSPFPVSRFSEAPGPWFLALGHAGSSCADSPACGPALQKTEDRKRRNGTRAACQSATVRPQWLSVF